MIDEDAYTESMEWLSKLDVEKIPANKVAAINLQKLTFERKNIPIIVNLL